MFRINLSSETLSIFWEMQIGFVRTRRSLRDADAVQLATAAAITEAPNHLCCSFKAFSVSWEEFYILGRCWRKSGRTCVRNHQPASSMTKHRGSFVKRPAQSQRDLWREEVFASSAQRRPHRDSSIVGSQAPWECLRVGHDMVLCPLCHPWIYREITVTVLQLNQRKTTGIWHNGKRKKRSEHSA